ncbi:MAG: hypothetical protein PHH21_03825, partial [Candidatus Pacebacteria bacterium]|nr:hypothetical protein [Candidatus Paceibacterota bacterium]
EKPVYCNECFDKGGNSPAKSNDNQYKEQFDILNAKLDRIIKALAPVQPIKEEAVVEKKAKAVKPKKTAVKKVVKKKKAKK